MSKETYNKIISKLQRMDEYIGYLEEIQKINKKDFVNDYHFFGLAERYLQLSIEILLDIGKLIITLERLKKPEDNQEIFAVLRDAKIISEKLVNNLIGIANFRNILVHEYDKINREIIYEKLRNNLDDFKNFKKEVLSFLNKTK